MSRLTYCVAITAIILILSIQSVNAEQYQINLLGMAYDHTTITIGYEDIGVESLDEAVKDSIKLWNDVIDNFAELFGYEYLSSLNLKLASSSNTDVEIEYKQSLQNACGRTYISHTDNGEIVHSVIEVSTSCVGQDYEAALTVIAHELGHALGLGHSTNEEDLMYEYYVEPRPPSTLDLYALAIVYEWIDDGTFSAPSSGTLSLPYTIAYQYLPAQSPPTLYHVRIFRETALGVVLLEEMEVAEGTVITYTVEEEINYGNDTRIVFDGWFTNSGEISTNPSLSLNITDNVDVYARYNVEYLVSIDYGYRLVEIWKRRGDMLNIAVPEFYEYPNLTRLAFQGWDGDFQGMDREFQVEVFSPLSSKVLWKKQYYVEVITNYIHLNKSGWYDVGVNLTLRVNTTSIPLNNGESKATFRGYAVDFFLERMEDYIHKGQVLTLRVESPVRVNLIWETLHHVIITSKYVQAILLDEWIKEGEQVKLHLNFEYVYPNGTKFVFKRWSGDLVSNSPTLTFTVSQPAKIQVEWSIYYFVRVESEFPVQGQVEKWMRRGSQLIVNASPLIRPVEHDVRAVFRGWEGSIITGDPSIVIESLETPVILKALWGTQYRVLVKAPQETELSGSSWIDSGGNFVKEAPELVPIDNKTRLRFQNWVGCTQNGTLCIIEGVGSPLILEAKYIVERLVKIEAIGFDGNTLQDVLFRLRSGNQYLEVNGGEEAWMPVGEWVVEYAEWRGYDVTSGERVSVDERDDLVKILVRVSRSAARITDIIGFPVEDARITVIDDQGRILFEGSTNERGELWGIGPLPPQELTIRVSYLWFSSEKRFSFLEPSPISLSVPFSLNSIYLLIAISSMITVMSFLVSYRRRRRPPEPYPEYLPPPPPPPGEEPPIHNHEKIVTLSDVLEHVEEGGQVVPEKKVEKRIRVKSRSRKKKRG